MKAARSKARWCWMNVGNLRAAYRWPWDHTGGGKYSAANDNGWVYWNRAWVHQSDLASTQRYWRLHGWRVEQ